MCDIAYLYVSGCVCVLWNLAFYPSSLYLNPHEKQKKKKQRKTKQTKKHKEKRKVFE